MVNDLSPVTGKRVDHANQLITALPHAQLVCQALKPAYAGTVAERSEVLDLALIDVRAVDRPSRTPLSMSAVLDHVRKTCADLHGGWVPTVGRNRILDHVTGVGEIDFGGDGAPTPPDPPVQWPERALGPGRGVRIGVLDTALSAQPWLAGGWVGQYSDTLEHHRPTGTLPAGAETRSPISGHATFVTGLVLRQAPGATVEVHRVLDDHGTADSWTVAKAIASSGQGGLDVLNLSLACWTEDNHPPLALSTAVNRVGPATVIVAAAGNHATTAQGKVAPPAWPAALDDVVAVGAATASGAGSAAFSPAQPWVDVLAPGVDLVSTYLDGPVRAGRRSVHFDGFARWSGTSFAAALVTGVIAAGIEPGRLTARQSWRDIRETLGPGRSAVPEARVPSLLVRVA